ncbi:MAG: hypothetical protein GPI90_19850 [Microcystis aeruginosa K13-05]|jgi:hypothetical protein|uniref:hypothetical protein n=1 Tax=Microcystis sp. LE19-41.2A TaxID=3016427 RepID=UPI0022C14C8E|nr:hypothetical protein [Microcystis sp. LE19-41.2A]MCZ8048256.1 hypothetical protein [Microcystis sp. LE19-41.2A]NCR80196.1 hypothetical protein [Microcystis aeruginosa K13-10]NCR86754.1 hypothetical protein [Microcystis aeruginosa K13-05]
MSKVISFSISDRYLDKIRSLYPDLTENLAAKQFLIDQLDASLDVSLDNNLDDKLRILIEKSLGDRLDATEKSISKWLLDFDNRINDIDREMKDRSIAIDDQIEKIKNRLDNWTLATNSDIKDIRDKSIKIDHQIKAIEARLDENLDTNLDANLDDSLDSSLYESYSEIFNDSPDESLDKSLDTKLNTKVDTNLAVIMDKRYPLSIITLIASTIKAIEARLYENLDTNLDTNLDDSLESYSEIFNDRPDESLDDNLDTKLDDSKEPVTLEEILLRKKAIREEWQTLKEILDQGRKDLPKSIEGLRKKAIREGWPRRDRENRKEYQIPVTK